MFKFFVLRYSDIGTYFFPLQETLFQNIQIMYVLFSLHAESPNPIFLYPQVILFNNIFSDLTKLLQTNKRHTVPIKSIHPLGGTCVSW